MPRTRNGTTAGSAFLVDPKGLKPAAIDGPIYEYLLKYLDLPDGPACEAIEWLLDQATRTPGLDDQEVVAKMIWHYTNTFDHSLAHGILANIHGTGEIDDLTKDEAETLQDTLAAIRLGGWFSDWLALRVKTIANGDGIPAHRHPTPLEVAASLYNQVEEHQANMEVARRCAETRPDLVLGATLEPVATQEPPAVPEANRPVVKHRARVRRHAKRKTHAKAAA
jgi:hypothetical protein